MNLSAYILKIIILSVFLLLLASCESPKEATILVFSKTAGYRHQSIAAGIKAIQKLGVENNFSVSITEDASKFKEDNLKKYAAVVFLNTTGNVLEINRCLFQWTPE